MPGLNVLDFGSGAGRDCFILSKLVGEDGFVTGIDMTEELVLKFCYGCNVCGNLKQTAWFNVLIIFQCESRAHKRLHSPNTFI